MFSNKDHDLLASYNIERLMLVYCGIYPNEGRINKILYKFSTIYHICATLLITASSCMAVVVNLEDIPSMVKALLVALPHCIFAYKFFNLIQKKQNLLDIEDIVSNSSFGCYSERQNPIVKDRIRSTQVFGMFYKTGCSSVAVSFGILPLFDNRQWVSSFTGWNPINVEREILYWAVFAFELLSLFAVVYITIAIDVLICILITVATSQFEVLKDNLSNMDYSCLGSNEEFRRNMILHKEILRLVSAIEDTFCSGTFVQFVFNVGIMCVAGFEMMMVPPNSIQFITLCGFFNAMMFEVAMYCWFGHNIIASSENINDALYLSNWYEADSSLKKSITIFMEKCKRPVVIRAKLLPLSLQTFTSIMRSSYSYFAVLRTMYGPE